MVTKTITPTEAKPTRLKMSYEEFLAWVDEDTHAEWVDQVLPGFWLRPTWLWQADTLNPLTAFLEMRGLTAAQIEQLQRTLQTGATDQAT